MNLSKKDGYLIIVAVIICIIISCLSPFIASGNPDGLEKSAEDAGLAEDYGVDGLMKFTHPHSQTTLLNH